ncbi:hypothetical protein HPB49_016350 [Dermacentor silvarum]|uniref:Uncharacterized protein n=1 Tax=Dermacentor silvarum TaxID=543639 RepID=A0ACB8DQ75_DERSI|nr:hypothetical protein HPB49_016350 [Dermacentor silvarum]
MAFERKISGLPPKQNLAARTCFEVASRKSSRGMAYDKLWVLECILMRMKSPQLYEHIRRHQIMALPREWTQILSVFSSRGNVREVLGNVDFADYVSVDNCTVVCSDDDTMTSLSKSSVMMTWMKRRKHRCDLCYHRCKTKHVRLQCRRQKWWYKQEASKLWPPRWRAVPLVLPESVFEYHYDKLVCSSCHVLADSGPCNSAWPLLPDAGDLECDLGSTTYSFPEMP